MNLNKSDTEKFPIPNRKTYIFDSVNLEDPRVWSLISSGRTKSIFQLETQLGQSYSKKLKPNSIKELAALISILRPVCLESGLADKFCKIKNGEEDIVYIHNSLEPILKDTYGCLVYQEQVIQICREIAGFTEIQADDARKATGKKLPEEMAKVKTMFMEGCISQKIVNEKIAEEIFSWIEKSVRYSFNLSHAISYAMISYWTAYQKYFYPTEFYTASLTFSSEKIDPKKEIEDLVQDARLHNIRILPPNILRKNIDFEIIKQGEIAFGLGHIRNVGQSAIKSIKNHKLDTWSDFLKSSKKLKRNVAEALIKSGACDCYNLERMEMLKQLHIIFGRNENEEMATDEVKKLTDTEYKQFIIEINEGIKDALDSIIIEEKCIGKRIPIIKKKIAYLDKEVKDSNRQRALWESIYLGLNLTTSAAEDYKNTIEDITTCKQTYNLPNRSKISLCVVIDRISIKKTSEKAKNPGLEFAIIDISDSTCKQTVMIWPTEYQMYKENLIENSVIYINGMKDSYNGREQIILKNLEYLG